MNKRLIIIFSTLAAVVLVVVMLCVIFITGNITVKCATDISLDDAQKQDVILSSGIAKYTSIFAVSEQQAIANIEQNFPAHKVISIERRFPNNIEIKLTGRVGIYAIKVAGGNVAVVDRELKILEILAINNEENSAEIREANNKKIASLTQVVGVELAATVAVGNFLSDNLWLKDLAMSAKELSFLDARFTSFIREISYNTAVVVNNIYIKLNSGVTVVIDQSNAAKMFNLSYAYFLQLRSNSPENLSKGYIITQEAQEGQVAGWVWKEWL